MGRALRSNAGPAMLMHDKPRRLPHPLPDSQFHHAIPSLLNPLNTLPLAPQILLPQRHPIIAPGHRQDVPAQAPTHPPQHGVEIQHRALPLVRVCRVRRPDPDRLVL